jgi:hypothetical protein
MFAIMMETFTLMVFGRHTMILIDGMPIIVSGLSTVYGLTGIPRILIESSRGCERSGIHFCNAIAVADYEYHMKKSPSST